MHTPLVDDWDDAPAIHAYLFPCWLRHVKVRPGWVAPAAVITGQSVVGWAEVGSRHGNRGAGLAPPGVTLAVAGDLVALPARSTVVEEGRAQRRRSRAVSRGVEVPVPARATCPKATKTVTSTVCHN